MEHFQHKLIKNPLLICLKSEAHVFTPVFCVFVLLDL